MPIRPGGDSYLWPYLLCRPFLMGVFGIFVGKVFKLLWKSNAGERGLMIHQTMEIHATEVLYCHVLSCPAHHNIISEVVRIQYMSLPLSSNMSYLAVLMGLGSKLP